MSEPLLITLEDAELLAAIDRAIGSLMNPQPMLAEIGKAIERATEERFNSKRDPSGKPWAPLSQTTVDVFYAQKYPEGIPGSLLERTRQLRDSLSFNVGGQGEAAYVEIGTSRSVPGRSQPSWEVGLLHEYGTVKMPRRGLLTADPKTGKLGAGDEADVLAIVNNYLAQALG